LPTTPKDECAIVLRKVEVGFSKPWNASDTGILGNDLSQLMFAVYDARRLQPAMGNNGQKAKGFTARL
jgi:hypothetical protein